MTDMKQEWTLDLSVTYLNHGSYGPSPRVVQQAQQQWTELLERNPQAFFGRRLETEIAAVDQRLADFVGCPAADLVCTNNATFGMNVVARSMPLAADDEILVTTHEYGAVKRIWQMLARTQGARMVQAPLPEPFVDTDSVVEQLFEFVTPRTRLIVVSHVTSPTALVLPVREICQRARENGIATCVDGPHAIAMRPLNLKALNCDFYVASCHKWLSGPFGSGFLYVHPRWQHDLQPALISWGGSMSGRPKSWKDEFVWLGTRAPAASLAIPAAIDFLESYGIEQFRVRTHELAQHARQRLEAEFATEAPFPDKLDWYGSMVAVPLPESVPVPKSWTGQPHPLQQVLYEKHRIEVPIIKWGHRMHIRVSCHLYNDEEDIERLIRALQLELR